MGLSNCPNILLECYYLVNINERESEKYERYTTFIYLLNFCRNPDLMVAIFNKQTI
jgi:hypothetical protein